MRALVAILLSLGLAGCSTEGDDPERAVTLDGEQSSGAGEDAQELAAHEQELTTEQAETALLTIQDMPTGWAVAEPQPEGDEGQDVVRPARCADLLGSLEGPDADEPVAEAETQFTNGGPSGVQLVESIDSYDEPVGDDITATADALGECSTFTTVDSEGTRTRFEVAAMSFPNLGDETLALQVAMAQDGLELTTSVVIIAVGHNAVTLGGGGFVDVPATELEQIARAAVEKLEETA